MTSTAPLDSLPAGAAERRRPIDWLVARLWIGAIVAATVQHGVASQNNNFRIFRAASRHLFAGLDPESGEADRIAATRSELFLERELPTLQPTRGARALLEHMLAVGLELTVATSAKEDEVRALLEQAGVSDLIRLASSADDAERSKPDPDIVQAALRLSRSQAAHSAMIGDTPYDVEAAARARVPAIALRCGGWWDDAALAQAAAIYDDPADLLAQFDDSPLGRSARVASG
jgi:phosphoglycolate phosphatase-like HAD superfamily hydrolase